VLNQARREVAGSQTDVILPSTSEEDRHIVSRHSLMLRIVSGWLIYKPYHVLVHG